MSRARCWQLSGRDRSTKWRPEEELTVCREVTCSDGCRDAAVYWMALSFILAA